jgi:hypothetical protein
MAVFDLPSIQLLLGLFPDLLIIRSAIPIDQTLQLALLLLLVPFT